MPKYDAKDYLSVEQYEDALGPFKAVTGYLLFELSLTPLSTRDLIIRNFIARTHVMADGIFRLWKAGDYQDCWILHRSMLDRLFHLVHLAENDEFDVFEAWSFREQFNAVNRVRSNPKFPGARASKSFSFTPEQVERSRSLDKNPPKWKRPRPEEVAKKMNLSVLYQHGYDFASAHVHPMANDGYQDFFTITKLKPQPDFPDQRIILSNTLLVSTMIVQEGLNASSFAWRNILFNFLDQLRDYLDTGDTKFGDTFLKLGEMLHSEIRLSEKNDKK